MLCLLKMINLLIITKNTQNIKLLWFQKQPPELFYKKVVLEHFIIFTGKHLCQSLFLINLQPWKPATLLKRDYSTGVFLQFCKLFKNSYLKKHLITADSHLLNWDPPLCWEEKILTLSIIELVDFITNLFTVAFNPLFEHIRQVPKLNSLFKETFFTLDVHWVMGDPGNSIVHNFLSTCD